MLKSQEIEALLILGSMENIGPQRCLSRQTAKSFVDYCLSKSLEISIDEIFEWVAGKASPSREIGDLLIDFAAEAAVLHVKFSVRMSGKKMPILMIKSGHEKYASATNKISFKAFGFSTETTEKIWKKTAASFQDDPIDFIEVENFSEAIIDPEWVFDSNDEIRN